MGIPLNIQSIDRSGTAVGLAGIGSLLSVVEPTDGLRGYAPGGIVLDTSTGRLYRNAGTFDSSEFVDISAPSAFNNSIANEAYDGGYTMPISPWTDATEIARSLFGVSAGADGPVVTGSVADLDTGSAWNITSAFHRGIGVSVDADAQLVGRISTSNYIGCKLLASDANVSLMRLFNNRDTNLWIAANVANAQSLNNHCYGGRFAIFNEGGSICSFTNDRANDAPVGYYGAAASFQCNLVNMLFQHNTNMDCVFRGYQNVMSACQVQCQVPVTQWATSSAVSGLPTYTGKVGLQLDGQANLITNTVFTLTNWYNPAHTPSGSPATAAIVINDSWNRLTNLIIYDADGLNGSTGIKINGALKGLTIDAQFEGDPNVSGNGWGHSTDRALVMGSACSGVDIKIGVHATSAGRTLASYVDIPMGWTGHIQVIDMDGVLTPIDKTDGSAI